MDNARWQAFLALIANGVYPERAWVDAEWLVDTFHPTAKNAQQRVPDVGEGEGTVIGERESSPTAP
jgi:hypothetical protein